MGEDAGMSKRTEEREREEVQLKSRNADHRRWRTSDIAGNAELVTRANENAQASVEDTADPSPGIEAGRLAVGTRMRSTASVQRSTDSLSSSHSDDTTESASTNRYAKK